MKTAKVWVLDVRVLWEHSAAWIAFETFVAEQLNVVGQRPFEFDVAGSRVAVTVHASVAANVVKREKRIVVMAEKAVVVLKLGMNVACRYGELDLLLL